MILVIQKTWMDYALSSNVVDVLKEKWEENDGDEIIKLFFETKRVRLEVLTT